MSGQPVFDFEYGVRWQDHLRFVDPDVARLDDRRAPDGRRRRPVRMSSPRWGPVTTRSRDLDDPQHIGCGTLRAVGRAGWRG